MDSEELEGQDEHYESAEEAQPKPRELPQDLPKSLDDRRAPQSYGGETEMYDGWQGQSQYTISAPLKFNLSSADNDDGDDFHRTAEDNDSKLMAMLAAQAAKREDGSSADDEDAVIADKKMLVEEKKALLQKTLHMAASNGEVERVRRLVNGPAKDYISINATDEEGTAPLIYASCFGHTDVVSVLLDAGALVDRQDRNQWTALMWAMTNRHKEITKALLDHGASTDIKSSSGRTAMDFAAPNSEMAGYLQEQGYQLGVAAATAGGASEDFYSAGFSQDRFEQELEEQEMRRRMMMDSSRDLEVDLSSLGMDERSETPEEEEEEQQEFIWERCLYDQMFVFQEEHLDQILDTIITNMIPQRSPSQKPVPANIIFLSARYAHYHATHDLLGALLVRAMDKINDKVEQCQWDMTVLAFWMSNATLLLYYLKRDPGLMEVTNEFQAQLSELIHEIFILIIRDAERRMDRVLDMAMLDHETIPGFEDVHFVNDWNIFRSKNKGPAPEPPSMRPQINARRTNPSPRNIASLLSSTLFVLDLYDVHSVIIAQVLAQLYYWLGAELFNHVMTRRKYLARTKAMQIRMNISALEDWARNNNRMPEHYESGALTATGEATVDSARRYLTPIIQMLQWLQCFSSISEDPDALENTFNQMTRLTPQQLQHSSHQYRYEVGEKYLSKAGRKRLQTLQAEYKKRLDDQRRQRDSSVPPPAKTPEPVTPAKGDPRKGGESKSEPEPVPVSSPIGVGVSVHEEEIDNKQLLMDPSHMLNFSLPTSVDLRLSYGPGYGGMNKERARKYVPTVPPEFLSKLELNGGGEIDKSGWEREADESKSPNLGE